MPHTLKLFCQLVLWSVIITQQLLFLYMYFNWCPNFHFYFSRTTSAPFWACCLATRRKSCAARTTWPSSNSCSPSPSCWPTSPSKTPRASTIPFPTSTWSSRSVVVSSILTKQSQLHFSWGCPKWNAMSTRRVQLIEWCYFSMRAQLIYIRKLPKWIQVLITYFIYSNSCRIRVDQNLSLTYRNFPRTNYYSLSKDPINMVFPTLTLSKLITKPNHLTN